ncbi:TetR/AcrR family transcriptional regulator [Methylobacterium terricola]|uniref:TetR/AcrR family transcriptional regulator n=1 Tax=Methylobacterium terricola TaxID=2583531 RepID=A0A5C4LEQ4_9HYPH|nr:TetR/AcrR family transcriptional regulator [Methylobacterium terricola]TNC11438.1 TetR/AcrR family transcriptional regulator [Methylobacterium terricola]
MRNDDRRERLKAALLDGAERTIAESGLSGLKARDLAKEVGCALGAIYTVFPDLDALILSVNLRTLALFDRVIATVPLPPEPDGPPTPAQRDAAVATLVRLAVAYLHFAAQNTTRWRALFQHRVTQALPDWYLVEQVRLFRYIEAPLRVLRPDLGERERALLARSLFSATHGLVSLGLDEKLMVLSEPVLRGQIEVVVGALGRGLAEG